jgi:hypothetical protein
VQTITTTVPIEVAKTIDRQARALQLGRRQYVRALLCAVALDTQRLEIVSPDEVREVADAVTTA